MIGFSLDILKELIITVTNKKIADDKSKSVRAFIALYDSIKRVEHTSEELLLIFEKYIESPQNNLDVSTLRVAIRQFSSVVCDFVESFRRVEKPLKIFEGELAKTFSNIGSSKLIICRSLMEVANPEICFDGSVTPTQQKYLLRVLDYAKYKYSANRVQKQWNKLVPKKQRLNLKTGLDYLRRVSDEESHQQRWVSESRTYSRYENRKNYGIQRYNIPLLKAHENSMRTVIGFKILTFNDLETLKQEIQIGWIRLANLREGTKELESFLSKSYSISDFF